MSEQESGGVSFVDSTNITRKGLAYTKIYLVLLFGGLPVLAHFDLLQIKPMGLNEIGDFLAGAFGPLALIWVVLGFFQQGEELRNSVKALKLQARELNNSVVQQKELVEVSREAIQFEREVRLTETRRQTLESLPDLLISFGSGGRQGGGKHKYMLRVRNTRATVSNFTFKVRHQGSEVISVQSDYFESGQELSNRSKDYVEAYTGEISACGNFNLSNGEAKSVEYKFEQDPMTDWPKFKAVPLDASK